MYGISSSTESHPENPYNYELVYAIFKARMKRIAYSSIFQNYYFGALTSYDGPNDEHKSVNSLRAFYHRYQPEVAVPIKQPSI